MIGLYRELEEERNASAIAANQAMAMITRLAGGEGCTPDGGITVSKDDGRAS